MTRYSTYNIVYRLQKWMDSVAGQTFLNYAYSWGASIVILGTLFKLTHLPGANFFLFLGMGTEVFVFFISAFDRPFDKTTDGMDLDVHMSDGSEAVPVGVTPVAVAGGEVPVGVTAGEPLVAGGGNAIVGGGTTVVGGGGTIVIGGGTGQPASTEPVTSPAEPVAAPVSQEQVDTEAIAAVATSVATVSGAAAMPPLPTVNPELEEATTNYVDELKRLTGMLSKVAEQSEKLGRNSEEMDNLDRTLTGICKIYEMQLKSASSQVSTIDEINEQTRHMAEQIQELNKIYARMIEAMQVRANI